MATFNTRLIAAVTVVSLTLMSCGQSTGDRMVSGAGIGAGVGAVGTAIAGGPVLGGALIGAGVGAAAGGLTNSSQVDLGRPIWK